MNFIGIQLCELLMMKVKNWQPMRATKYTGKDFDRLYSMVKKVCLDKFNINVCLNEKFFVMHVWQNEKGEYEPTPGLDSEYYIDHQSCVTEDCCMKMFESEESLYNFLRFEESYIRGGNDNN